MPSNRSKPDARRPTRRATRKASTPDAKIILITALEPSGDRLGAAVMKELQKKRKNLKFIGIGGPEMQALGLHSIVPMQSLAVMGLAEVIPAIPHVLRTIHKLKQLAQQQPPNLILTIDAHDFSSRLAKALKTIKPNQNLIPNPQSLIPHLHYNAPKVWAWRQSRAKSLKDIYTHLLVTLPFEVPFFQAHGLPTTYVGHPATGLTSEFRIPNTEFRSLALLPGSRTSELKAHWPLMLATYRRLKKLIPNLTAQLVLPTAQHATLCQQLAPFEASEGIHLTDPTTRFQTLATCAAALAKSGTNNLEIALLGLPAVVCYRMHPITHWLAKWLVKVPFISLPNLILNRCVYPEYIQHAATSENLSRALYPLFTQAKSRTHQTKFLAQLHTLMHTPQSPAEMAAEIVLKYLDINNKI